MQEMLKSEWTKLISIRTGEELFRIYFRTNQLVALAGIALQLCLMPLLFGGMAFDGAAALAIPAIVTGVTVLVMMVAVLEYGLRCVERGQFRGVAIGVFTALWTLPSYWFLVGLFGLYSFLNAEFQKAKLVEAPPVFLNFLSAVHLNFAGEAKNNAGQLQL